MQSAWNLKFDIEANVQPAGLGPGPTNVRALLVIFVHSDRILWGSLWYPRNTWYTLWMPPVNLGDMQGCTKDATLVYTRDHESVPMDRNNTLRMYTGVHPCLLPPAY